MTDCVHENTELFGTKLAIDKVGDPTRMRIYGARLLLSIAVVMTLTLYISPLKPAVADPVTDAENSVRYQVNAICKNANTAVNVIPEPKESAMGTPRAWTVLKEYYSKYLKVLSPYVTQLHQVSLDQTGDGFKVTLQQYLSQVDAEVAAARGLVHALKKLDRAAAVASEKKLNAAYKGQTRLAKQLKLSDCK